tara:strand:+ start:99 stop:614 length:516 start_codon:yes stop_codon:yes gene_type:complete
MKYIFIPFFLLIIISSYGQNMALENGRIIWQKIYSSNKSIDEIHNLILKSGNFSDIKKTGSQITANINQFLLNRKLSKSSGSLYMYTDDITGFVLIEFKEQRYRITVKNLTFISNTEIHALGDGVGARTPLERYALNGNGEYRKAYLKRDEGVIDANLNQIFNPQIRDNDW